MAVKLTYFNILGRGEPIRLLLSISNIVFQDLRVTRDEWDLLKPTLRWPHLPMLEIDGKVLFQSRSICRYIARKSGLVGSCELHEVMIDMIADALEDLREKVANFYYLPDSPEREDGLKIKSKDIISFYFNNFQEQLTENDGYLVGGKLTWADVMFSAYADHLSYLLGEDVLTDFAELKRYTERINELPGIREKIASRPEMPKDLRSIFN